MTAARVTAARKQPSLAEAILMRMVSARTLILFLFHALVFSGCYGFAWLLRFEWTIPPEYLETFKWSFPVIVGGQLLVGAFFGFYRGWWRYVGITDVVRLVFGLTTAVALLLAGWYAGATFGVEGRFVKTPRGALLIDWAFALLTLFGARVLIRMGRDRFRPAAMPREERRVLIVGAGDAGETLAREIEHRPQLGLKVVAFVDDHRAKWGSHIRGIRIFGPITRVAELAAEFRADEALIAIPSASGRRLREIIRVLSSADLKFKTMPGIDQLVSGRVHITRLRPVDIEDLLRRTRIELPGDPVRALFRGKRVMITGAGGTIGSELAVQVAQLEPQSVTLVERSEAALYQVRHRLSREAGPVTARICSRLVDLCDTDIMEALIAEQRPQIVLHAAAHKHVPLGEENPGEYLRNNALATRTLADLCVRHGVARFVFISTDKAINPSSVMGATKRAAEILLRDLLRDNASMTLTIVRFGNVIGSSGSVVPLFMEQIAAGGPITVTHPEVTRYFIRPSEAISLVLQAATLGDAGHVFMLDMGDPVKIIDLARDLIRLSNHGADDIAITFTGLRPGEKLFEELRLQGESIHPTVHPQIVVTELPQPDHDRVSLWLSSISRNDAARSAHELLQALVSEYEPAGEVAADQNPAPTAAPVVGALVPAN